MKFIDSVKQIDGPGGTLEKWRLNNGLILCYWKDETFYSLFFKSNTNALYTECIFKRLNHPYNNIKMEFGSIMPPKIKIEHKYFEKFIQLTEKLKIEDLEPDPFTG